MTESFSPDRIEAEKLIQLLLMDSELDHSEVSDPNFTECVTRLTNVSLPELSDTPRRIQYEQEHLRQKIEHLAVENYCIFLANAETNREVNREFKTISSNSECLLTEVSKTSASAQSVFGNVDSFSHFFGTTVKAIEQHTHVSRFNC